MTDFDAAWDAWNADHGTCSGFRYLPGYATVECCDHPGTLIPVPEAA